MKAIKKAICIINYKKPQASILAEKAIKFLSYSGVSFTAPIGAIGYSAHALENYKEEIAASNADVAIIFGGDGTLIKSSGILAPLGIPVMGVNLGTLGFLISVEPSAMEESLTFLVSGDYTLENRILLQGSLIRGDKVLHEFSAVNDIVVNNSVVARTIYLDCIINGERSIPYEGDGVVIATPTGSTAYSLSAGGPIVLPQTDVFLITPVAPHNLYARPIVTSSNSEVIIIYKSEDLKALVTYDGQGQYQMETGDQVVVRKGEHKAQFVWVGKQKFLTNLRHKMCSGVK